MAKETVGVRLAPEFRVELEEEAERIQRTLSWFAAQLIERGWQAYQKEQGETA